MENYPGNSYKERGILMNFLEPKFRSCKIHKSRYRVLIKHDVCPTDIFICFDTFVKALVFARIACSETKPCIRIYLASGMLLFTITYQN